jgi:thiosulfate/3-mercaptopyruvate sulfurtransferase
LTLQNGVDSVDELAAAVGARKVIGGSTYIAAAVAAPGVIEQTGTHRRIVFGEVSGDTSRVSSRVQALHEAFASADIVSEPVADAHLPIWEKFCYLAPFAGFTGAARCNRPLWADATIRQRFVEAVAEVRPSRALRSQVGRHGRTRRRLHRQHSRNAVLAPHRPAAGQTHRSRSAARRALPQSSSAQRKRANHGGAVRRPEATCCRIAIHGNIVGLSRPSLTLANNPRELRSASNDRESEGDMPYTIPNVLVTTDWVAQHATDASVRIVEVDVDTTAYEQGHVPGAAGWNWTTELCDTLVRDIVPMKKLEELLGRHRQQTTIVLCGDSNRWFWRGRWRLKIYRHDDVRIMDGGRKKWRAGRARGAPTGRRFRPGSGNWPRHVAAHSCRKCSRPRRTSRPRSSTSAGAGVHRRNSCAAGCPKPAFRAARPGAAFLGVACNDDGTFKN